MPNKADVMNLAIGHLGVGKYIGNENEISSEAKACNRWWNLGYRRTLRAWDWTFAKRFVELGLVQNNPTLEWAFSYRYPSGCAFFRRILSGLARDNSSSKIPYQIASDDQGKLILTNQPLARGQYTADVPLINLWDDDFTMAFSAYLAFLIAPQLTSNDQGAINRMAALANQYLQDACANSSNEEMDFNPPEAEAIRAREGEFGYGPHRNEMFPW